MSKFVELAQILKKVRNVSKNIINDSLQIMNQIQNTDSAFVDELLDSRNLEETQELRERLLEELQQASLALGWTDDAETVISEIDHFIIEEDDVYTVNANPDVCPFLTEVWNGDSYDKTGIEGLSALFADLNNQLKNITAEKLLASVQK